VFDHRAPTAADLVLDRLTPHDNRYDIGIGVGVQKSETGDIVEASIKLDGLDAQVKAVKQFEELTENIS